MLVVLDKLVVVTQAAAAAVQDLLVILTDQVMVEMVSLIQ